MRMWMTDPAIMCRQHLLGEHVELHMFVGTINKGISVAGYLSDNLLEPSSLKSRHSELVNEMLRRGYSHQSPLPEVTMGLEESDLAVKIDRVASRNELTRRCPVCAAQQVKDHYVKP